ncbi:MAG: hypothetical protein F6J86_45870 [Symploca sp. SIO1B1]|nr:hypothetical protein [Symploca sp. SIO1B1]
MLVDSNIIIYSAQPEHPNTKTLFNPVRARNPTQCSPALDYAIALLIFS